MLLLWRLAGIVLVYTSLCVNYLLEMALGKLWLPKFASGQTQLASENSTAPVPGGFLGIVLFNGLDVQCCCLKLVLNDILAVPPLLLTVTSGD